MRRMFTGFRTQRLFAAAFALLLHIPMMPAAPASPTPEETAALLKERALTNALAFDIVAGLTTRIGPRLAGSEAERRAADWSKQEFERLGFDRVWIESFPIADGWERGVERAEIVSPSPQPLVITALGGSVATPAKGIEAEIALFKTFKELLAAPEGALKGKIAVVTQRMARSRTGAGYGEVQPIRSAGPSEAARRGAVAYLMRSASTSSQRFPHTGGTRYATDAPAIPAAALSVPDAEQLERLAGQDGAVRVKLLLTPRRLGPVSSQNVIAEVRGRETPDEVVLIGAHLDSWDLGTGAIDDGAGVAIVAAAAKLIRDLPQRPRRTIFQTGVADPDAPSLRRMRAALAPLGIDPGDNRSRGSSDVTPMFQRGVPAVTLQMDGTEYFDLHHTPNDTLDKIDRAKLNQSTAAYAVFTYLAAELEGQYRASGTASGRAAPAVSGGAR
jgi:Zn-dependent M28 family amino/carboxypeptidase